MLFATSPFFASVVLVQVVCLLPRYLYMYIQTMYYPRDVDIIREALGQWRFALASWNDLCHFADSL
jgi:hypothetical protein